MNRQFFLLIAGDIVGAILALFFAYLVRFEAIPTIGDLSVIRGGRVISFVLIVVFSSFFLEIYSQDRIAGNKDVAARITLALILSFFGLSAFYYLIPFIKYGRGFLFLSLALFGLFQFVWHVCYSTWSSFPGFATRVLILGTGPLARQIGNIITSSKSNYVLSGYVNCACEPINVPLNTIIGNDGGLYETVKRERAHKIVVSLSERRGVFPLQEVLSCKLSGIEVVDAPSFFEQLTGKLLLENITPSWFIFSHGFRVTLLLRLYKRVIDVCCSLVGLILVAPFLPLVALLIRFDSPGPILFRQVRVGEKEKNFVLYKFRTMRVDAESATGAVWAEKNDPRVTPIGSFLRKSRIDEIPQLFNVLKGDMSVVGPRPERPEFVVKLKEIIPYYSERHFVKPGVTGWAQVRYPYGSSVEDAIEKLRYDLYHIKNISLAFDFMIMLETVKVVLFRRGGR